MKKYLAIALGLTLGLGTARCQDLAQTRAVLRKVADRILQETSYQFVDTRTGKLYANLAGVPPSPDMKVMSRYNDWHYTNGVLGIAMLELSEALHDTAYAAYVRRNMAFVFQPDNYRYFKAQYDSVLSGQDGLRRVSALSWCMLYRMIRLDDYGTMAACLAAMDATHTRPAYRDYLQRAVHALMYAEPRLEDGTIARYFPHQMTIWADDLYMSVSLLAREGQRSGDRKYFDDAVRQVRQFHRYLWDSSRQLYYHCYYTDTKHHGVAFWGRCNGWVMMAQADLLSLLPKDHPARNELIRLFREEAEGIARYQSASGLWHQLLDKEDAFLETSASAMFTFSLARGVNQGWLEPDFAQVAYAGWKGVLSQISAQGDVTGICPGTGIAPSTVAYYNRPQLSNLAMGEGPVLRAGAEMLSLKPYRETPAYQTYHLVRDRSPAGP